MYKAEKIVVNDWKRHNRLKITLALKHYQRI